MKCHCARSASLAVMLAVASTAWCQDTSPQSLFPLPPLPSVASGYPVSRAAATDALWGDNQVSPVQTAPAPLSPTQKDTGLSTDYADAMKGGYESCSTCMGGGCNRCGCGGYVYANALVMSRTKSCGFVPSVDSVTGDQRLNFCNSEFGSIWRGGMEVGAGWCFGSNCCGCCTNAVELVYWGLYPTQSSIHSFDNMNSTIDFSDLTYNGAPANNAFQNAEAQKVANSWGFNSVEANIVGNCSGCGPFGCGMCGCCCGSCGNRWGFGYTAGFRYMNIFDRFIYSSTPNFDFQDPAALNYLVATQNNLFGFQLGGGVQYCVTNNFRAYAIGKAGIYDNSVTALQRVYGTQGNAITNNGPFNGNDFVVRTAPMATLATSAQLDLGGRWAMTDHWTLNFGYRVLGVAGVANVDNNIHTGNFQNWDGIAFTNRCGNFLVHGVFAGAVYCF
jgi:hypothetical protein